MLKSKSKILAILLSMVLVIGMIPASAFADTVVTELNFTYDEAACKIDTSLTEGQVDSAIGKNSSLDETAMANFSADLAYLDQGTWYIVADGTNQVSSDKQYAVFFGVRLKDGYSWPEGVSSEDMSGVKIMVNGKEYKPSSDYVSAYPNGWVFISYIPDGQKSKIAKLEASTAAPILYKTPSYEVTTAGEGYKVSVENWYSGPKIPELTGGTVMAPTDKFREGIKYMVELKFTADEGYSFIDKLSVSVANSSGWRIESQDSNTVVAFVYMEYAKHVHSPGDWVSDSGSHWKVCSVCDEKVDTAVHTAGSWIVDKEATDVTEGSRHMECTVCHYVMKTEVIPAGKVSIESAEAKLSASSYAYTGAVKRPAVTVKDGDKELVEGTDFAVSYSNNKYVGTAKVIIKGIGAYTGEIEKTFKINPSKVTLSKVSKVSSGKFKAAWKKHSTQTTGFQIRYSTSSTFKTYKTVTVSGKSAVSKTVSKLKKGKKYYVKVRAYKTVNGTRYYGSWSAVKSVRV